MESIDKISKQKQSGESQGTCYWYVNHVLINFLFWIMFVKTLTSSFVLAGKIETLTSRSYFVRLAIDGFMNHA